MSQNPYLAIGHTLRFMKKKKKKGNVYAISSHYYSRFYKMIIRPYIKILRHCSLDYNVCDFKCQTFIVSEI